MAVKKKAKKTAVKKAKRGRPAKKGGKKTTRRVKKK